MRGVLQNLQKVSHASQTGMVNIGSQTGKDASCVSGRNHACLCISLSTPALSQAGKRLQNGSELTGVNQPVSNLLEGQLGVPVLEGECSVVRSCLFKRLEIAQVKVQKRNDTIYN